MVVVVVAVVINALMSIGISHECFSGTSVGIAKQKSSCIPNRHSACDSQAQKLSVVLASSV